LTSQLDIKRIFARVEHRWEPFAPRGMRAYQHPEFTAVVTADPQATAKKGIRIV
jgi:hypothetical protein